MPSPARTSLILLLAMLLLLTTPVALLLGLTGTQAGSRLLLDQASHWSGGLFHWRAAEGRLLGPLTLRGVRISQPGLELEVHSLQFAWQPGKLLRGQLAIEQLSVDGIRAVLTPTEPTETGEPFRPSRWSSPLDIQLRQLRMRNLQIVQGDQAPLILDSVEIEAGLWGDELTLQQLVVRERRGDLSASLSTRLQDRMPLRLQAEVDWALPPPTTSPPGTLAGGAAGTAPGTSSPAAPLAERTVAADLALEGTIEWRDSIGFDLQYRATGDGLTALAPELPTELPADGAIRGRWQDELLDVAQLSLTVANARVAVAGQVQLPANADPAFDLALRWRGLQWPLEGSDPQLRSDRGSLNLAGTAADYSVELEAALTTPDLPDTRWQGRATGDLQGLNLERLDAQLLDGSLTVQGPLQWESEPRWALRIAGRALNPEPVLPGIAGELAFTLDTSGALDPELGPAVELRLEELRGTLLDHAINGVARAELEGATVRLHQLDIESEGNRIAARGTVAEDALALEWQLDAPSPGALVAGASGSLEASGTLAGTPAAPRLAARLRGSALQWNELALAAITGSMVAGPGPEDRLELELTGEAIENAGEPLVDSVRIRAGGTTGKHALQLHLTAGENRLETALAGGLDSVRQAWQGRLTALSADGGQYGQWQLAQPAPLALAGDEAALGESCLGHAQTAARLCLRGRWSSPTPPEAGAAGQAALSIGLHSLPVELLDPRLTGILDGAAALALAGDGALSSDASLNLSPGQLKLQPEQGGQQLAHAGGQLKLSVDGSGLAGTFNFAPTGQGRVEAQLQLPAFTHLPLPAPQPLSGQLLAALPDLGGLAAWIPELDSTAGSLRADVTLAGSLEEPLVSGSFSVREGAAQIPSAGLALAGIELRATSSAANQGILDIEGDMNSGDGSARLTGQLSIPERSLALALTGDRLEVYNTADARALLSPDLQIGWRDELLTVRGRLTIPEADITPKLGIRPGMLAEEAEGDGQAGKLITPSADVVVIEVGESSPRVDPQPQAPFRMDSQVELALGDRVKVDALGFISRITGSVLFTNTPGQADLLPMARGRLSLEDGTFRALGQDLDIQTGQVIFADVPVTEPELNVRAVRWIDNDPNVTAAGVLITGPATEPVLELFSRPQLEISEIQSYLLTGRSARERTDVLSIGTYLSPRFYVGYGYNLLEETNEFNSLFNITPRYGVGASVGEADNNVNLTFTHER